MFKSRNRKIARRRCQDYTGVESRIADNDLTREIQTQSGLALTKQLDKKRNL